MWRSIALSLLLFHFLCSTYAMISKTLTKSFSLGRLSTSLLFSRHRLHASSSFLPTEALTSEESERASRCAAFLDSSPDPFHCVQTISSQLEDRGFVKLHESSLWASNGTLKPGGKYYSTRYGSSIVAFTIGSQYKAGNALKIMGAHTDSPNLKLKPNSKRSNTNTGVVQLNVETYGGGLWHTWFDRDLSLSGRVILRTTPPDSSPSPLPQLETRLIKLDHSILRIPNLCIHLRTPEEREAFKVNKEDHLAPILCQEIANTLNSNNNISVSGSNNSNMDNWSKGQEPALMNALAGYLQCKVEEIKDFELNLYDTQPAAKTGLCGEFLASSRIDNLASCFVLTEALLDHSASLEEDDSITMLALFDHEEVGSESFVGAGSTLISDTITRLLSDRLLSGSDSSGNTQEVIMTTKAKSMILSVDMAHAVHPNYASKHEKQHSPTMNAGVVIKSNSNQRYATNTLTGFLFRELARRAGENGGEPLPVQEFAVRNDCPCGSTIGPTLSTNTGIRAIDLGMPMLSMHSIREVMGCKDLSYAYRLFRTFLKDFSTIDSSIKY